MLVTFISQCEKKALNRTRRILDAFANRIGDNVWQTAITEDGLDTVKKLLRQSATKSTAVSCHRVRTRQRSELVWVVGNRKKFDAQGMVAVNRTKRNILHSEWENNWQNLNAIAIISTLSALLHDIGKSTNGFQHKLFHPSRLGDPYRHEWISLKLLIWLVKDCQTDNDIWQRLQTLDTFLASHHPTIQDLQGNIEKSEFDKLPPVTQWIAWLIVTHHRLPSLEGYYFNASQQQNYLKIDNRHFKRDLNKYYQKIEPMEYWVKNPKSIDEMTDKEKAQFFSFDDLVLNSPDWQKQVKRYARKAEQDIVLQQLSQKDIDIANPFLLMLSRMSVMVADHNYSSLKKEDKAKRVQGSKDWETKLIANTDRKTKEPNQALDEHLLGVARFTAEFCRSLPILHEKLPKIINHEPLIKNTGNALFAWQNKAFKLALSQSEHSETHGFFGVNMASTGCGKTIGNARIMYALANPKKGARLTIALGLRVLTLQTGQSFRQNLNLTDSQLAILVGGQAQKQLFEIHQQQDDKENHFAQFGSESAEDLIDEWVDSDDFDGILDELKLGTVIEDSSARKLLGSPIVTCTIDHLMQATECKRGGKYIAPMLRLFSGDLILDEPDDFDQNDMPALSRLVHLSGLLGSRILLSSATLPPDMVEGLFQAYLAGRKIYNEQFGYVSPQVCCAWFDENNAMSEPCQNNEQFHLTHDNFIQKRCQFLQKQPTRRMAEILPINAKYHGEKLAEFYQTLAKDLLQYAHHFHQQYHVSANEKNISIGLIRMANIQPLMQLAQAMHQLQQLDLADHQQNDTHFYLCCYHSQQVLALRNRLENRLDSILTRKNVSAEDFIERKDIAQAIAKNPSKINHVFIVLATPVAEVGRDHDYDWAMVEPSSMRSIIQLAGRVWRHRSDLVANTPNIGIWQYNIRALKSHVQTNSNQPVFAQPGFENKQYLLDSHDMKQLINDDTLQKIDAVSRIQKSSELLPKTSLVDLEQQVMADLMNNSQFNVVNAYFKDEQTSNRHHVHLSVLTPFRAGRANVEYIVKPVEDTFNIYNAENVRELGLYHADTVNSVIQPYQISTTSPLVDVWLDSHLEDVLAELGQKFPELSPNSIVIRFSNIALAEHQNGYYFDERFGCWKK